MRILLFCFLAPLFVGCRTAPPASKDVVPVHEVVNQVKRDLIDLGGTVWKKSVAARPDSKCKSEDGQQIVILSLKDIRLNLKAVMGKEIAPTGGLEAPLGVLSIDPTIARTINYSSANSVDLVLSGPPSKEPIDLPQKAATSPQLFAAVADVANEILLIDHSIEPCLLPKQLKASIFFDVVRKDSQGLTLKVIGLKLGTKRTTTNEYHQLLEVTFELSGSSQAY